MTGIVNAMRGLGAAVIADREAIRRYGEKFRGMEGGMGPLPLELMQRIGLQMMVMVRVMQALDSAQIPVLPKVVSRLIRHAYGAEIHWKARIEPGVAIVHGCGLVISHAAQVGSGCILFQNVTLGESIDPETREVGAPVLGRDVHVGPGATLLGPISVGERSKVMAGAVLARSVDPNSVVRPAASTVETR